MTTQKQTQHEWDSYYQQVQNRYFAQSFEKGKKDGLCGEENNNVAHMTPCPYYQAGYVMGIHERLLDQKGVKPTEYQNWILVAELKDPRFPLSSPATYTLMLKNTLE